MEPMEEDIPVKKPLVSYGTPQISGVGVGVGEGAQRLTTKDALDYLTKVRNTFLNQRDKHDMFFGILKDFKAQRIDAKVVRDRVNELFKGHNDLILGFNIFMPKELKLKIPISFGEAINFVNKIKERFQNDDQVYKSFLDTLNMYKIRYSVEDVHDRVSALFANHPDLLDEFRSFLPNTLATTPVQHMPAGGNSMDRSDELEKATIKFLLCKL